MTLAIAATVTTAEVRAADGQQPAVDPRPISASVLQQIESLIREKTSRSPAEQKMDSQLIYELRMRAGEPITAGLDRVATDVAYAADGHAILDVTAKAGSDLTARLATVGAEILSSSTDRSCLRIHIAIERVETLAADPDVLYIQPRQDSKIFGGAVPAAQGITAANTGQGSRTSEGDVVHLAFAARAAFGARGAGVKIGVLSDGVASLASSQARGDLGSVTVLQGQAGVGDEGTAMLEIIHDLAPDAQLFFATGVTGITTFAQNIRKLRAAGCDIIVDDVLYPVESPLHDGQATTQYGVPTGVVSRRNLGLVTQAVNDVTALGALYVSAAGNFGNLDSGTSGTWEGDFADFYPPLVNGPYTLHDFGGSRFANILLAGTTSPITLYWSDPLGSATNDYDLFRVNAEGTQILAFSNNLQGFGEDPYEEMSGAGSAPGQQIIIAKVAGSQPRFLHLDTNGGRLSVATAGELRGHPQAAAALAVAATPAFAAFPSAFTGSNVVETFTSDGPRRLFFRPDNTPYTPSLLSGGGELRQKPDVTAADGVQITGLGGLGNSFLGTSAAAAHAAAIAALMKSARPALGADQLRAALVSNALDIHAPGVDRDSGAGIIVATKALHAVAAAAPAVGPVEIARIVASDNPGNGNGVPEAGEGARLSIPLANYGDAPATGVTATITTTTPGITVAEPSTLRYGNIPPYGSSLADPIRFTIASDFPCPMAATFTVTVHDDATAIPRVFDFQVPIGVSSYRFSKDLDGTTPEAAPRVDTSTGVQPSRLFRDGIASTCGVRKPAPPLSDLLLRNRQFDSYTLNTCAQSIPSCVTVNLQGTNAASLAADAYSPTLNPANVLENYRADAGGTSFFRTFSFDHPGAGQPFVIDVHDVDPGTPSKTAYTLTVTGACMGACDPPNHVPVAKATDVTVAAPANACGTTASIDDGSFDADGDVLEITQSPPGPYDIGTTEVLLTVKDPKGAISQASARVTVVDKTPPQLTCPDPITVSAEAGLCSAPVSFPTDATDTCSGPVKVVSTAASGSIFPLGTTTVLTTATDTAGNTTTCPLTVKVIDTEPPHVTCPDPITVAAGADVCNATVSFDPTATDVCSSPVSIVSTPASGSIFALGVTTVTTTATDAAGNSASCPVVVTVVDKQPPRLTCPAPITVPTAPGVCNAPVTFAPTATDACSSDVTVVSTPASGSTFPLGTTTVRSAATDAAGNTSTCPVVVTVVDKEPPTINNLVLRPATTSPNRDFVDVTVDYGLGDNCPAATCVLSVSGGATQSTLTSIIGSTIRESLTGTDSDSTEVNFIIIDAHHVRLNADRSGEGNSRTYTVTVTCKDAAGNTSAKSATITVRRRS